MQYMKEIPHTSKKCSRQLRTKQSV